MKAILSTHNKVDAFLNVVFAVWKNLLEIEVRVSGILVLERATRRQQ